ncbi:MAG: hypothetical protein GY727_16135 [Gammaproteobacteria bacterium]|nr:hypothetical protein [Gammaproteobacteria bacterium]MCP4089169.1 hypothetical protein [Gammaproteobacteria bacterium]MCP4276807.1 hypothetical protein [Gammaproteobacteria bacterium]MCP4830650.1 hypothetical protein [Gammaproteobacteria bacterium]MCP4928459.1 hypothetical protein [Gammaproteobacteria bacterium]
MKKVLFRYLAYALGVTVGTVLVMFLGARLPGGLQFDREVSGVITSEFSPVELLQNLLLIFCASVFSWIAFRDRLRRPMVIGFGILFIIFLIRELDFFLDVYLLDNLWQVLCAVLLSVVVVYGVRNHDRYSQGWRRSWPSAGLALIIGGMILLIPFAQLIGHEPLWKIIMGDEYVRVVKVASEEFIELGAYIIITIGTIEFLYAWSRLPRTRNIDGRPRRRR